MKETNTSIQLSDQNRNFRKLILNCLLLFLLFLALSQAVYAQDFSSIDQDLKQLENLITDTINSMEEQQRLLTDLRENLSESEVLIESYGKIILEQENLLLNLRFQLSEMSETYRMQSALSAKYEKSSRFWKTFTLIAAPAAALISGTAIWLIMR